MRFKHDIVLLRRLDDDLGYYRFVYNGGHTAFVGLMAQEVQRVAPEAVTLARPRGCVTYQSAGHRSRNACSRPKAQVPGFVAKVGLALKSRRELQASGTRQAGQR
jgi:hypothetical protein